MNAIHNITVNNGWAMAITGYTIVLCGLAILALIISQLHRIIEFFDKQHSKAPPHEMQTTSQDSTVDKKTDIDPLSDPAATARCYQPLTMGLGDAFPLNSLYELFKQGKHRSSTSDHPLPARKRIFDACWRWSVRLECRLTLILNRIKVD